MSSSKKQVMKANYNITLIKSLACYFCLWKMLLYFLSLSQASELGSLDIEIKGHGCLAFVEEVCGNGWQWCAIVEP
jgi:hypothetical protein